MAQQHQPLQPGSLDDAPQVDDLDPELQAQAAAKALYDKYSAMSYKELAQRMVELKNEITEKDTALKLLGAEFDLIRLKVVPEKLQKDDMTSIRITGVGRLGLSADAYCSVIPGCKPDLVAWMLSHPEYKLLVKEDVNPSTLKSLVKTMAQEAAEAAQDIDLEAELSDAEPADTEKSEFELISRFVNYTPFMRASVTKG